MAASTPAVHALFVGQWAPTFLIVGMYNRMVKLHDSDGVYVSFASFINDDIFVPPGGRHAVSISHGIESWRCLQIAVTSWLPAECPL